MNCDSYWHNCAASFVILSAVRFQSLGMRQNIGCMPSLSSLSTVSSSASHRSLFAMGLPARVHQPFWIHPAKRSVIPSTTYCESVARTVRRKPSPAQYRMRSNRRPQLGVVAHLHVVGAVGPAPLERGLDVFRRRSRMKVKCPTWAGVPLFTHAPLV
jgi:hypothetical protein